MQNYPVAIIGAGPIGLAAAANLVERDLPFTIIEAGPGAGAAIREWGHVQLFSPWQHCIDPASRRLLAAAGWMAPPDNRHPTGRE
ncbi:MAG: FAD-dependent oxidoreductase, partial [Acidimicrobiia bacterium]|nr:FAD-dependent oxidoreductase [Acidimicrobiia bacterium]